MKAAAIQFEDLERPELNSLDLRRDGAWSKEEAYIDRDDGSGPPSSGRSGLGGGGLMGWDWPTRAGTQRAGAARHADRAGVADLRFGLRVLAKAPAFSVAAVALIAMGIGGNVTIYSLVHGVLSKPAPCVRADGLVSMGVSVDGQLDAPGHSFVDYVDFAAATRSMRSLAAIDPGRFTMDTPDGGRYRMRAQSISAGYFDMLGVHLAMGRTFTAANERICAPGLHPRVSRVGEPVRPRLGILGRTVLLNGQAATIVGVGERGFYGAGFAPNLEIALPLTPRDMSRSQRRLQLIGRLAPGFSIEAAQSEFDAISRRLEAQYPETNEARVVLAPYTATAFGPNSGRQARFFMAILSAVGMLTLLVVCANVANLMLARAATRQPQMAVRLSISPSPVASVEDLVRRGSGAVAAGGGRSLSVRRVGHTGAAAVCAAARIGSANAGEPDAVLAGGDVCRAAGRCEHGGIYAGSGGTGVAAGPAALARIGGAMRGTRAQPAGQPAGGHAVSGLYFVLLTGASMMRQSLQLIDTHDLYFTKDHLLLASIDTSGVTAGGAQNLSLLERLRQRIRALPGVVSASYATVAPPRAASGLQVESGTTTLTADGDFVGPDYLEALGVPVLSGRGILDTSVAGGPAMAAMNRKLATALWPGQSAVGRTIRLDGAPAQVVGVVPDGAFSAIGPGGGIAGVGKSERGNFLFVGLRAANSPGQMILHVRYAGSFQTIAPAVREAIRQTDPRVASFNIRTMDADWAELTSPVRFISALLEIFAAGSLVLAAIGLYAVAAFYTARRTREFGIRLALGASPRHMQQGVLTDAILLAGSGVVVGAALSAAVGRALGALLFGMSAADPATWLRATLLLGAVSVLAAYLPARRAAKIDPMAELRME